MISAKVVADSKNQWGNRLTTLLVVMPRYILAEFNTHRMLSKNSASSRAIPFEKNLRSVQENPFIPMAWQQEHSGMQGTIYLDDLRGNELHEEFNENFSAKEILDGIWGRPGTCERGQGSALYHIIDCAKELAKYKVTKQMANRLLEPFMWHTVLVSGTEWMNFFELRCPKYFTEVNGNKQYFKSWKDKIRHIKFIEAFNGSNNEGLIKSIEEASILEKLRNNEGMADIHMMATAEAIWDAMNESTPKVLDENEWHVPFGDDIDDDIILQNFEDRDIIKIATARAARTSYTTIDSTDLPNSIEQYKKDIDLHDRLLKSGHWSCFEHCAKPMTQQQMYVQCRHQGIDFEHNGEDTIQHGMLGNFRGFIQYRKMFANENITK